MLTWKLLETAGVAVSILNRRIRRMSGSAFKFVCTGKESSRQRTVRVRLWNRFKLWLDTCRFERTPITEPKEWWHKMPVAHKNVYKRLPLDHVGAENAISEHTIARAHDRAAPLQLKMFYSNNYGKRSFAATDTKVS
jgi:hypothetical protein